MMNAFVEIVMGNISKCAKHGVTMNALVIEGKFVEDPGLIASIQQVYFQLNDDIRASVVRNRYRYISISLSYF